jgi:aryl-alcohol dehydrogenase-like predicted oxidoreductase
MIDKMVATAAVGRPSVPLSADLPPLIMGSATFNTQYNPDPYMLPTTALVHRALSSGIRAFDTSPYYGPAEELLGRALSTDFVRARFLRSTYRLLTKVGRVTASSFDYSPAWVRYSIRRSLQRLETPYLDVVYCHDVEFVTPQEVLDAVRELRRIRDTEGTVRYVGISGYPVRVLCSLSEMILHETGEPLDVVMSYANFTLQSTRLLTEGLPRLLAAGVDVVLNASPLGMGLLRRQGVPIGSMGDFHPASEGLRKAIRAASAWVDEQGEKLEVVAIRFSLKSWLRQGAKVGVQGIPLTPPADADSGFSSVANIGKDNRLGPTVIGVSHMDELEETLRLWRIILEDSRDSLIDSDVTSQHVVNGDNIVVNNDWLSTASHPKTHRNIASNSEDSQPPQAKRPTSFPSLAQGVRSILGNKWIDYEWPSPGPNFIRLHPAGNEVALEGNKGAKKEQNPN